MLAKNAIITTPQKILICRNQRSQKNTQKSAMLIENTRCESMDYNAKLIVIKFIITKYKNTVSHTCAMSIIILSNLSTFAIVIANQIVHV